MASTGTNDFPYNGTIKTGRTDNFGNAWETKGTAANLPTGAVGYAVGATYVAEDTGAHYVNTGSTTSATWSQLANSASALFNIRFSGQPTTVGGAAAEAFTVTGVAATDRAFVQVVNDGTSNRTVLQAVCTTNTLTVTFSGDPGNDVVFNYIIVRAA